MSQYRLVSTETLDSIERKLGLHEPNCIANALGKIEDATKIRRLYVLAVLATLISLYLILGPKAQLLCHAIVLLYPMNESIKVMKLVNRDDARKWLTYWILVGVFLIIECFIDEILIIFPPYWLLKTVILLWCFFPVQQGNNGSAVVYRTMIGPFFAER